MKKEICLLISPIKQDIQWVCPLWVWPFTYCQKTDSALKQLIEPPGPEPKYLRPWVQSI